MNLRVRFGRFSAVSLLGIGVQLAALWLLTDVTHLHYLFATSAAVALAVVHNFFWHRSWTWRDRSGTRGLPAFTRFAAANGALSLVGNLGVMATLVPAAGARHLVVANAVAIGACGLLNFCIGNTVVFRQAEHRCR